MHTVAEREKMCVIITKSSHALIIPRLKRLNIHSEITISAKMILCSFFVWL